MFEYRIHTAAAAIFCFVFAVNAAPVSAQDDKINVAVLGIQSIEGDDKVAQQLTTALQQAAAAHSGWSVLEQGVSIRQLSLAHGCDALDNTCLTSISRSLGVDKLIYGTLRRSNLTEKHDFFFELHIFDLQSRQVQYSINDAVPQALARSGNFGSVAQDYIRQLARRPEPSTIIVRVINTDNAEVRVDNRVVLVPAGQEAATAKVPPGQHQILVTAPDHIPFRQEVSTAPGEQISVQVNLVEGSEGPEDEGGTSALTWLGWGSIVGGTVLLGLAGYSALRLHAIDQDGDLEAYRTLPGIGTYPNVCAAARDDYTGPSGSTDVDVQRVESLCDEADTLEVLQYVFLGLGVATVGLGITFLLLDDDGEPEEEDEFGYVAQAPRLELRPSVGPRQAMLNAIVTF